MERFKDIHTAREFTRASPWKPPLCSTVMLGTLAPLFVAAWFVALLYGFLVQYAFQKMWSGYPAATESGEAAPESFERAQSQQGESEGGWYIRTADAQHLVQRLRLQDAGLEPGWKQMMDKEVPGNYRYTAFKRGIPDGLTEYRTITTCPGISTIEFSEFLVDDSARRKWESFSQHVSILEQGDWAHSREQVVRWLRRFPFAFLSDREYLIANRLFTRRPDSDSLLPLSCVKPGWEIYACTRGLDDHPNLPHSEAGLVRTAKFNSNWRCRSVPWPGGGTAAEVVLLHSEDIKIPEALARWAVMIGMPGFVHELTGGLFAFVAARRERGLHPDILDPHGYGHDFRSQEPAVEQQQQHHHHQYQYQQQQPQQLQRVHRSTGASQGRVRCQVQQIEQHLSRPEAVRLLEAPHLYSHTSHPQARAQRSSCKQRGELGAQRIREGEQDSGLRPLAPAGQVETEEPVPYPPGSRIVVSNAGSNQEQQHGLLPKWGKRIGAALILVGAFSLMKGRSTKAKLASKKGGG